MRTLRSAIPPALLLCLLAGASATFPRGLSWDESIYLSQVDLAAPALPFAPSRSRGITVIAAPVGAGHAPVTVVRIWMLAVTIALIAWMVRVWSRTVGEVTAGLAAAILCSSWLVCFYATEVMPNLPAALLAMVVAGAWIDGTPRRSRGVVVCIAMAALATLRPLDATILFGVLVASSPWLMADRSVPRTAWSWLLAGWAVGVAAWLIEMSIRSGGLVAAIRGAISTGHVGDAELVERLRQYLDLIDGPTIGPVATASLPWVGILVLVMCGCLAAIGCRGADRRAALLGVVGAACLGLVYIGFVGGIATRFLLPALAFACIPMALGMTWLWSASAVGKVASVGLAALILAWNVATLASVGRVVGQRREAVQRIGALVAPQARTPCSVRSDAMFPQVAYAAGCDGRPLGDLELHPSGGEEVAPVRTFVVSAVRMHDACLRASGAEADTYIYVVATGCSVDPI